MLSPRGGARGGVAGDPRPWSQASISVARGSAGPSPSLGDPREQRWEPPGGARAPGRTPPPRSPRWRWREGPHGQPGPRSACSVRGVQLRSRDWAGGSTRTLGFCNFAPLLITKLSSHLNSVRGSLEPELPYGGGWRGPRLTTHRRGHTQAGPASRSARQRGSGPEGWRPHCRPRGGFSVCRGLRRREAAACGSGCWWCSAREPAAGTASP